MGGGLRGGDGDGGGGAVVGDRRTLGGSGGARRELLHVHHSLLHEPLLPHPLLEPLLSEVDLDPGADGDRAALLVAGLGVGVAEDEELLAQGAVARLAKLAVPGVLEYPLDLDAPWQLAVDVLALAGVEEVLDALLDGLLACLHWVLGDLGLSVVHV